MDRIITRNQKRMKPTPVEENPDARVVEKPKQVVEEEDESFSEEMDEDETCNYVPFEQ